MLPLVPIPLLHMHGIGLDLTGERPEPLLSPLDGRPNGLRQAMDRLVRVGKVPGDRDDRTGLVQLPDHVDPHRKIHIRVLNERL